MIPSPLTATIFDLRRYAVHDGPGIRTTLFFKGCPLACAWCHNPEGQRPEPELWQRPGSCIRCGACAGACPEGAVTMTPDGPVTDRTICQVCGACAAACPAGGRELAGRNITLEEALAEIERDRAFYDESGGGVTCSGGEPLLQLGFVTALLQTCRERELHTVLDTCGWAAWDAFEAVLPHVNLFYYDLKHLDPARHRELTGVPNQRILANLQGLSEQGAHLVLRLPVIPGANDEDENWRRTAEFAASLPHLERADLLPYHAIGRGKYERLGRPYPLPDSLPPTPERMEAIAGFFKERKITVKIH